MSQDHAKEEVKARTDIVNLIQEYVQLKRAGTNFKGLCPFHNEKSPSFMVSPERQSFHCFGCGKGGDAFTFLMEREGLTFVEALEMLARKAGVELKRSPGQKHERSRRERLIEAIAEAGVFFRSWLPRSKDALAYLEKRGISPAMRERFGLGFAPDGWHGLRDHLRARGYTDEDILKAGLGAEGRHGIYDIFRARLVFPINDLQGRTIAFGGRIIGEGEPKYLNSPESEAFHKGTTLYALDHARAGIKAEGLAAVVEGYMDALMCHQHGFTAAVAPLGTALTPGQLTLLSRYSRELVIVFDGDKAGQSAARRSLGAALEQGLRPRVLMLPEGDDPDTILRREGADAFRARLLKAASPVEFMLAEGTDDARVSEALRMVSLIPEPIMRDRAVAELADRARVGERAVREQLRRYRTTGAMAPPTRARVKAYDEEMLLLSALIHSPALAADAVERLGAEGLRNEVVGGLIKRIAGVKRPGDSPLDAMVLAESDVERTVLARLSMEPGFDPEDVGQTVEDCLKKILTRAPGREMADLKERLSEAERAGDYQKQIELLTRINELRKRDQGGL